VQGSSNGCSRLTWPQIVVKQMFSGAKTTAEAK